MSYNAKKKKIKTNTVFSGNIFLLGLEEQGHGSDLFHFGDKMGYRQIGTDDVCVLAKRCYWVLWKSFSYAVIQSSLEAGEWTPGEDSFMKGRCSHLYVYSVDTCQEKSVLSFCDAWSSCLVRYKPDCGHPGHLAEMNTTAQVLQVQHVHKCFTKSSPNCPECWLYH